MFIASTLCQRGSSGGFDFDYDGDNSASRSSSVAAHNPEHGTVIVSPRSTSPLGRSVVREHLYPSYTSSRARAFDIDPMQNTRAVVVEPVHVIEPIVKPVVEVYEPFYPTLETRMNGIALRDPHRAMVVGLD